VISWRNGITSVHGKREQTIGSFSFDLGGALSYSSRYGTGYRAGGEARYQLINQWNAILGGSVSREFPGPQHELLPSLSFGDSVQETRLHRFRIFEMKTGLRNLRGPIEFGLYGFVGRAEVPVLLPRTGIMRMSDFARYAGWSIALSAHGGERIRYQSEMKIDFTGGPGANRMWPRPVTEMLTRGSLSRLFFSDALQCSLQGKAHVLRWADGSSSPDGTLVLLDAGISAHVRSLLFTYTIENIANRDMKWFDTFGWRGRNAYWGIRWSLRN
jgi:hypothetical protein